MKRKKENTSEVCFVLLCVEAHGAQVMWIESRTYRCFWPPLSWTPRSPTSVSYFWGMFYEFQYSLARVWVWCTGGGKRAPSSHPREKEYKNKDKMTALTSIKEAALASLAASSMSSSDGSRSVPSNPYIMFFFTDLPNRVGSCDTIETCWLNHVGLKSETYTKKRLSFSARWQTIGRILQNQHACLTSWPSKRTRPDEGS